MSGIHEDLVLLEREVGLQDGLHAFMQMAWSIVEPGTQFVDSWAVGAICEHAQAAVEGEIKKLVINVPPGCSKSRTLGCFLPAWKWARTPDFRWIYAAYGEKLINRDAKDFWKLITSNWYKDRWGTSFDLPTVPRIEHIQNSKTGWRLGTTPGGEVTGFHGNAHVIDDPIKPEELTELELARVRDWRGRTMSSRWRRAPGQVTTEMLIMQRLHVMDLSEELIEEGAVHVMIPMEYEPARAYSTPWGRDMRTEEGELLLPERFSADVVAEMKQRLGPIQAAAQLQQDPVPAGGAVFKQSAFRFWAPPHLAAGLPGTLELPKTFDCLILSLDCAFKDDEKIHDWVVCQLWGKRGWNYFLIDQYREHVDFDSTVQAVIGMTQKHRTVGKILVEDKANGPAVISVLEKRWPGRLEKAVPKRSKTDRAVAVTPFFGDPAKGRTGNVFFPHESIPGYAWVGKDFLPEVIRFPRGKHDDQVDCMSQALTYLQENANYLAEAMAAVKRAGPGRVPGIS